MFTKNYSAPSTYYADYNVYSAKNQEQWSHKKDAEAIECDVCQKKSHDIFMRVYYSGVNTYNFCSPKCWGNININKK
jgi:hypothetical protein